MAEEKESGLGLRVRDAAPAADETAGPDLVRGLLSIDGGPTESAATPEMKKAFKFGGLPVKLAEEPLTCVAEGAARALRNRPLLTAYGRS